MMLGGRMASGHSGGARTECQSARGGMRVLDDGDALAIAVTEAQV